VAAVTSPKPRPIESQMMSALDASEAVSESSGSESDAAALRRLRVASGAAEAVLSQQQALCLGEESACLRGESARLRGESAARRASLKASHGDSPPLARDVRCQ
jgi:hypothetical protein